MLRLKKKLNDHLTSYTKLIHYLSRQVSKILTRDNIFFLLDMCYFNNGDYQN